MAACSYCLREMIDEATTTCTVGDVGYPDGTGSKPVVYGQETRFGSTYVAEARCHDCNVVPGAFHHPGCDWEECPRCRGQIISCGC